MAKAKVSSIDATIGARLRSARHAAELTQEELGERIGVSFQQVQKYELGRNRISVSRLLEMASVLGVSLDYFHEGLIHTASEQQFQGSRAQDLLSYANKAEGISILRAFAAIRNPTVRRRLVALAQAIAGMGNC